MKSTALLPFWLKVTESRGPGVKKEEGRKRKEEGEGASRGK